MDSDTKTQNLPNLIADLLGKDGLNIDNLFADLWKRMGVACLPVGRPPYYTALDFINALV